jgi:hypothetical protein
MCQFCENIKDEKFTWQVRSTYADDNICEFVNGNDCDICSGCKTWFNLTGYDYKGNTYVGVTYNQILSNGETDVIIRPFSESIQFNYCPFCGQQISKEVLDFKDFHLHQISIDD